MAKLSNSSLTEFFKCPIAYDNRYVQGLQKGTTPDYFQFGQRMHGLLQAYYVGLSAVGVGYNPDRPSWISNELENEAHAMMAAYKAAYPTEAFEVLEVEHNFEIGLASGHTYIGRFDCLIRDKATRKLMILEHKTENRGSKRNLPQAWIARTQGSLYAWAASQVYKEPIDSVLLNICTRGTPGKQIGPGFRRDLLHRSQAQITKALATFDYVANQVDAGIFVENTNSCVTDKGWNCDYYDKCHLGADPTLVQVSPYSYLTL